MTPGLVVIGAGGHAAVLIDTILLSDPDREMIAVDADSARTGDRVCGVLVVGTDAALSGLADSGVEEFVVGVGGVGDNSSRKRLWAMAVGLGLTPFTVAHPSAVIAVTARVPEGTQVMPNAVVGSRAELGVGCVLNTASVVEHDCQLGDFVHVASGAILASGVVVGHGAHLGAGCVVRQGVRIGDRAIVGAGAAVVKDVPPDTTVVGVPARPLEA